MATKVIRRTKAQKKENTKTEAPKDENEKLKEFEKKVKEKRDKWVEEKKRKEREVAQMVRRTWRELNKLFNSNYEPPKRRVVSFN
jgi:hypothetical protein